MKASKQLFYRPMLGLLEWSGDWVHVVLGSVYMALLSQVEIPLLPVPVTLQTFAVLSLALFQGAKKSSCSLLLYLFGGAIGLPVFPSCYADPLWILRPWAGYLLAFPVASYVAGVFAERKPFSRTRMLFGLVLAQGLIYVLGVSWLSLSMGWQGAIVGGFLPFVLFGGVKLLAAAAIKIGVDAFRGGKDV